MDIAYNAHTIFVSDQYTVKTPPGQWSGAVRHRTWVLDFSIAPDLEIRLENGVEFTWAPYTWLLYRPQVTYWTRYRRAVRPHVAMWLLFSMPTPDFLSTDKMCTILHDPEEVLAGRLRTMYGLQERGTAGWRLQLQGGLLEILGRIEEAAAGAGTGEPNNPWRIGSASGMDFDSGEAPAGLLQALDRLVLGRLRRPPGVEELAAALHLSPSSLMHRLKASTGWTVVARVRWLRIREARRRLELPGRSVKAVAHELGFSSQGYFSRVFKAVAGVWPSEMGRS